MNRSVIGRLAASFAVAAMTLAGSAPAAVAGNADAPVNSVVNFSDSLRSDGSFQARAGVSGTVDTAAWRLTSDLDSGEAPRFAPLRESIGHDAIGQAVAGSWSGLGSNGSGDGPIQTTGGSVLAIAISGSNLYIGGSITDVGGIPEADFVARWDGAAWHSLGGSGGVSALNGSANALSIVGGDVFVGGTFTDASGISTADFIAKWNGSFWSALGSNFAGDGALNNSVATLAVLGSSVYVAGYFTDAATITVADRLAVWTGSGWAPFSPNAEDHPDAVIKSLVLHGGGLYAGGSFQDLGGLAATDFIARWNWNDWESVGDGLTGAVESIAISAGGTLYAGGSFQDAGGQAPADFVARLDGSTWVALGSNGVGNGAINSTVWAVATSGNNVFVGGQYSNAANIPQADRLAVFDGSSWSALGSNGAGDGALNGTVQALALGSSLIVGGEFTNAGNVATADRIAAYGPLAGHKPDARIRIGSGSLVGNDIYNGTGASQTKTGSKAPGQTITFGISAQNDGNAAGRVRFSASGTAVTGYTVKYFRGTTEITSAVIAGTYQSTVLAVGGTFVITAKVTVKAAAASGSSISRLVTVRSVEDPSRIDVVKLVARRS